MRAEPLNTRTASTDTNTSTTFSLLLAVRTQCCIWSLDKGGCSSNSKIVPAELLSLLDDKIFNSLLYLSTNVSNHITRKTLMWLNNHIKTTKILSVRSSPDPPILKKNCSPIQSWSGQNWLQSWSSPIQTWSVLISASHFCWKTLMLVSRSSCVFTQFFLRNSIAKTNTFERFLYENQCKNLYIVKKLWQRRFSRSFF